MVLTWKIMLSNSCPSSFSKSFSKGFSFSSGMANLAGLWWTDFNNLQKTTQKNHFIKNPNTFHKCLLFLVFSSFTLIPTSKWSHSTFYTSSSVPSVWRGSPWSHPGWWGPPEVLPDVHTLPDCRQRESVNTRRHVSVKNHMKMKITWKCTPVDSMIFVAPLRYKKIIIQQHGIHVTQHNK